MAVGRLTQASKVRKPEKYVNFATNMTRWEKGRTQGGVAYYQAGAVSWDDYYTLDAEGQDDELLDGNTGWDRQYEGVPIFPYAQSLMRRCVLQNDGEAVAYYLDCDNSVKKAGEWLRVHEGSFDPVSGVPNIDPLDRNGSPTLREGIPAWDDETEYEPGERVLHNDLLWECLEGNSNVEPESGTEDAVLDGTDGQVMVEIPRFYLWCEFDEFTSRHAWEIFCDPEEVKPYPDLTLANEELKTERFLKKRKFVVHEAFQKAGVERTHRYYGAFRASRTSTTNDAEGLLQSVASRGYASNTSFVNYRAKARNMNDGLSDPSGNANNVWHLLDFRLLHAVRTLFLTEYRTFHSQAVLGGGRNNNNLTNSSGGGRTVGLGNTSGGHNSAGALVSVGETSYTDGVLYRGIADLYGGSWLHVDGVGFSDNVLYQCNTPSLFIGSTFTGPGFEPINSYPTSATPNLIDGWFMGWSAGTPATVATKGLCDHLTVTWSGARVYSTSGRDGESSEIGLFRGSNNFAPTGGGAADGTTVLAR